MEECNLLACFHGLLSLLFHTTQGHLPAHSELGPPTPIINQENAGTDLSTGQFDRCIFFN